MGRRAPGPAADLDLPLFARLIVAAGEDAARLTLVHPDRYPPERIASIARAGLAVLPASARPSGAPPPAALEALRPPAPPAPVTAPSGRVPRAARRDQLLDVTLELIAADGFGALSLEAIARRAGVNRTIVYRSFAGMPVLLATLLRREELRTRRTLDAPTEAIDVDLLARMLLSTGEELGRMVLKDPDFPPSRVARSAWDLLDTVPVG